jgi:hypothetical protein
MKMALGQFMTDRRIYHVTRRTDDSWQVLKEGFTRPHIIRDSKEEAVTVARRLARGNPDGQVIVHRADNVVEREYHY